MPGRVPRLTAGGLLRELPRFDSRTAAARRGTRESSRRTGAAARDGPLLSFRSVPFLSQFFVDVLDILGARANCDAGPLLVPGEVDGFLDFIERLALRDRGADKLPQLHKVTALLVDQRHVALFA